MATVEGQRVVVEVKTVVGDAEPLDEFDAAKAHRTRRAAAEISAGRVDLIGVRLSEAAVEVRWVPDID